MLTPKGEGILRELSLHHRDELQTAGPALVQALRRATRAIKKSPSSHTSRFSKSRRRLLTAQPAENPRF
jgi:hypothetical protein